MIKFQDLTKSYKSLEIETLALHNINLEIKQGEFVSIMGPSGCGKSTLLNIMGMIDSCTAGSYYFNDQLINKLSERKRAELRKNNIGFVFQSFNLIDELTVYENVELPLIYLKIASSERKLRVTEVLEKLQLINRANSFPQQLSGGQQQKVAIGRAIISKPKLILADEPTGNLDSTYGKEVMQILSRLNEEGTTLIIVTHSEFIAQYSQKKILLFDGRILSETNFNSPEITTN
ncbi:MAG: ABC transporter ATP-binding protein [Bacteroidetes bacterium]|nr:ABC transporter ATP-binding protein [Bacteroidota bacterium]MBT5529720.1 ABC transporter ATP-binding protein [Cytophagia bacterium]MBT3424670.1 ABC transporter ATP-binding protein [Bacteroidota bacterium]MBT3933216.1 ABC transporter ATP-binding protein [Bacteroidota bacterium]MBT4727017.1 ABC transporter ATP-binding protein [Bacteroidota bacterium]